MGGNAIPVQPHGELKRERIARLRHHHQLRKPRSRNMRRREGIAPGAPCK